MRKARLLIRIAFCVVATVVVAAPRLMADELAAPERPIEEVVDQYIDAGLTAAKITAAHAADDANFIRRVTLDLAGRIPATSEVQAYVQSTELDKKAKLVDRLLASPDFVFHQRNELDVLLMAAKGDE